VPPGALIAGPCTGHAGYQDLQSSNRRYSTGGGGGGYATNGAPGGFIDLVGTPVGTGLGGTAFENADLVPLRGGCSGGDAYSGALVGAGGGAIQLVSGTAIEIASGVTINANGQGGDASQEASGGGGSGGAILIEAPIVRISDGARLLANGAGGRAGDFGAASPASMSDQQQPDATCAVPAPECGYGGAGAAGAALPRPGEFLTYITTPGVWVVAGGGGGSVGFVRINTKDGTYTNTSNVVESPTPSTAIVGTR